MNKGVLYGCIAIVLILAVTFVFSSYNSLVQLDEKVMADWSQVLNQYKRRYDLIDNLVATVQGYADHEKETLTEVTALRSHAAQAGNVPNLTDSKQAMENFQNAQNALSAGLGRLLVVVERYPELQANANFLALQSQLEGTENRIAVARRDYIETVRKYNVRVRTYPTKWIAGWTGMEPKQTFDIPMEEQQAPKVKFK